jgi:hypothetical protein
MFAGTDFYDVYTGVGARRIRETFEMLRNFAPAVLFIDEFDALGAARGAAAAGDESASIINEMLVQVRLCNCCWPSDETAARSRNTNFDCICSQMPTQCNAWHCKSAYCCAQHVGCRAIGIKGHRSCQQKQLMHIL